VSLLGPTIPTPDWIEDARRYYSRIEVDRRDSVQVLTLPEEGDVSDKNPGALCMRLAVEGRDVRVLDAAGHEEGLIRSQGPGLGYSMRRDDLSVWAVSTRSIFMRHHDLRFSDGRTWHVSTPFFWWMNIVCTEDGAPRALGQVGPRKWLWFLWIEPGRDHRDVLSALAFMHRRWWRR
jgi:hypothetical protein